MQNIQAGSHKGEINSRLIDILIYWLTDLLTDWLKNDWLTDWLIEWLFYWLTDFLISDYATSALNATNDANLNKL